MLKCVKNISKEIYETEQEIKSGDYCYTSNIDTYMKAMKDDSFIIVKVLQNDESIKKLKEKGNNVIELK